MKVRTSVIVRPRAGALVLAATCAVLMAACGGGGGDSSPDENNPRFGTARLTPANQEAAARAALLVLTGTVASGAGGALGAERSMALAATQAATTAGRPSGGPLIAAVPARLLAAAGVPAAEVGRARPLAVIGPIVEPCAFGGTRSITFDDRDNSNLPSAGDVIEAVDTACRDRADTRSDGRVRLTLGNVQVTPTLSLQASGAFFDYVFASTTTSRRVTVGGPFTLALSEPDANRTLAQFGTGNDFVVTVAHPRGNDTVTLLSGYRIDLEEQLSNPR